MEIDREEERNTQIEDAESEDFEREQVFNSEEPIINKEKGINKVKHCFYTTTKNFAALLCKESVIFVVVICL